MCNKFGYCKCPEPDVYLDYDEDPFEPVKACMNCDKLIQPTGREAVNTMTGREQRYAIVETTVAIR
jgi:hypothetical protein